MAIGWLTVLKSVPWADVVSNAPMVADGARKLWKMAARNSRTATPDATEHTAMPGNPAPNLATLEKKIAELEGVATELQHQMATSSELIKALAEQNTQLIQRLESMRRRAFWLAGMLALIGLVAVTALGVGLKL